MFFLLGIIALIILGYLILRMVFRDAARAAASVAALSRKQGEIPWWLGLIILLIAVGVWYYLDRVVFK